MFYHLFKRGICYLTPNLWGLLIETCFYLFRQVVIKFQIGYGELLLLVFAVSSVS